jgi:rhodanese-related sulfurtransferase
MGHIPGAVNANAKELFQVDNLTALPPDGQVVVYCYSGQTAGQVVSVLNMLGYDAYSLSFGMPGWAIVDGIESGLWRDAMSLGYPVETGSANALQPAAEAYFSQGFKLIDAELLYENLNDGDASNDPYVVDIRSAEDYAAGHIPGAVNVSGADFFKPDKLPKLPSDGAIVVTCYSGQTAGQVVGALNTLGYDAYSLKFGMKSWTIEGVTKGLWTDDMSMGYPTDTEPVAMEAGANPLPTPLAEDGAEAALAYFGQGFKLIKADLLYENLNDGDASNDPYIVDIRSAEHYGMGHIPGAVNANAKELFNADSLAALPPDQQVVVYCYSGQTAGQVVSVLNMLGYDAYSLSYGMPGWAIVDGIESGLWRDAMSLGYPVETGAPTPEPGEEPTPEPGEEPVIVPLEGEDGNCIACHTSAETLKVLAVEQEVEEDLSEGEG